MTGGIALTPKRHLIRRTPTLAARAELWIETRSCKPVTKRKYRETFAHIPESLKTACVGRIDRDDMTRLVAELTDLYAPKTVHATIALLKAIFEEAVACAIIERNPAKNLGNLPPKKNLRKAHAITRAEYARLIAAAPEDYTALVALLPLTGLRIAEAAGLDKRDVDLKRRVLRVKHQVVDGKLTDVLKTVAARRTIDLSPQACEWFRTQAALLPRTPWVFGGANGNRLSPRIADEVFVKLRIATGIDVKPHDLRHTYGSWLVLSGADPLYVAGQMGHKDPSFSLRTYCHETTEKDPSRVAKLGVWLAGTTEEDRGK